MARGIEKHVDHHYYMEHAAHKLNVMLHDPRVWAILALILAAALIILYAAWSEGTSPESVEPRFEYFPYW
ncbi:hypothetical protein STSP2_03419 [Anaerohalosphaera lusitana]|uniref:Uncharacterized protein n=1 Tax=Anaerohalosphaera lusitana TaxID=1936003 RepID=A0A1U9NQK3_9BACT|nr:hypothetical protein [Anaerohalosphaera lusitana]AQT70213.1 hypothetical protein STSP2_03419 [Anaerohalosphaera lusitana]